MPYDWIDRRTRDYFAAVAPPPLSDEDNPLNTASPEGDDTEFLSEPSFNAPESSPPPPQDRPSVLQRYRQAEDQFHQGKEAVQKIRSGIESRLSQRAAARGAAQAGTVATKAAGQAAIKAGTQVATKAGTKVAVGAALGAATGGIATAVQIGVELLSNKTVQKIIAILLLFAIGSVFILITAISTGFRNSGAHNGADPSGGTFPQPERGNIAPALAAQDKGIAAYVTLEALDTHRNKMALLLQENKLGLSGDKSQEARRILNEARTIRLTMRASAHASSGEKIANDEKAYRDKMNQLFSLIYPNGQGLASVRSLVDQGRIKLAGRTCNPSADLMSNTSLQPRLLTALAEMGQISSFTITCMRSGHGRITSSGKVSNHTYGIAADIAALPNSEEANKLLPFLFENRERLQIRELIFNAPAAGQPAGYFNIQQGRVHQKPFAGDHTTHIHIAVQPE